MVGEFLRLLWINKIPIIGLILIIALVNLWSENRNKEKIFEITTEKNVLLAQINDSDKLVAELQGEKAELKTEINGHKTERQDLLAQINEVQSENESIKAALIATRASTQNIRTQAGLLDAFKERYVWVAQNVGLMDIYVPEIDDTISHMVAPTGLLDQLVDYYDRIQANEELLVNYQFNEDQYGSVVDLTKKVEAAQEKISHFDERIIGIEAKAKEAALNKYTVCVDERVVELKKPRIDLGNKWAFVGGGIAGFVTCSVLDINFKF